MSFLSDADRARVRGAIEAAERKTRGEFVTVIAGKADGYLYIPLLWAALLALLVPAVTQLFPGTWFALHDYITQIVVFVVVAVLFRWPPLKHRLIPKSVQHRRAHHLALEQFLLQNLHATRERTGVLLFVSVAEHYVEIIADKGINDCVDKDAWQRLIDDFLAQVKRGAVADGFVTTIEACGELLARHFPAGEGDRNELPNHLVELD